MASQGVLSDGVTSWASEGVQDYGALRELLPLSELELIPTSRGRFECSSALASTPRVALVRTHCPLAAIGVNVLDSAHVGFAIPTAFSRDFRVNGLDLEPGSVFVTGRENALYMQGGGREVLGVAVRGNDFVETVAALRGCGPEDVALDEPVLRLRPRDKRALRVRLTQILAASASSSRREFEDEVLTAITDAYLSTHPEPAQTRGGCGRASSDARIVRVVEERFAAAQEGRVSLADLCAAAGVGKSRLYQAFHALCGQPPLAYFQRRKLVTARSRLLASPPERGAVKRVALDLGMTELGRFAVEYRALFGESPSATLGRAAELRG